MFNKSFLYLFLTKRCTMNIGEDFPDGTNGTPSPWTCPSEATPEPEPTSEPVPTPDTEPTSTSGASSPGDADPTPSKIPSQSISGSSNTSAPTETGTFSPANSNTRSELPALETQPPAPTSDALGTVAPSFLSALLISVAIMAL
ncbi:hypothetical protein RRF57_003207 [Xylaria bambusicola]|uniref:Uncharacterized protein n=1 Tax=Xylaria bambusicola TaxID=326684 RepID=A0AAN7UG92_9PEZI